ITEIEADDKPRLVFDSVGPSRASMATNPTAMPTTMSPGTAFDPEKDKLGAEIVLELAALNMLCTR
ncbi:MAG: hypothetical protein WAN64_03295, partial [Pseudolabrys sp.]